MKDKKKILIILENAHSRLSRTVRMRIPTYGIDSCNRKNATYSRILPYLEPYFEIRFGETTPLIAPNRNHKQKFPVDHLWIEEMVNSDEWFAIIPACAKAEKALTEMHIKFDYALPHPVSFKWRKVLIEECRQFLCDKEKANGNR